jgi:hypothetical protein
MMEAPDEDIPVWDPLGEATEAVEADTVRRDYRKSRALHGALAEHREAVDQAALWQQRCAEWTREHGRGVWRARHPRDMQKLRERRYWRDQVKRTEFYLAQELEHATPAGRS